MNVQHLRNFCQKLNINCAKIWSGPKGENKNPAFVSGQTYQVKAVGNLFYSFFLIQAKKITLKYHEKFWKILIIFCNIFLKILGNKLISDNFQPNLWGFWFLKKSLPKCKIWIGWAHKTVPLLGLMIFFFCFFFLGGVGRCIAQL